MNYYTIMRRSAIALCIVAFSSVPFALSAQSKKSSHTNVSDRPHHIIINALFDYAMVRDKVISPLLYHTIKGGLTLGYEYRSMRHEHRVLIQMMAGTITRPGLDTIPGGGSYSSGLAAQWSSEYSFAITVLRMREWHLGLGAMIDMAGDLRTYQHIWSPVVGFSTSWNIGPSIVAGWQVAPRHNLRFRFAMPFMSIVKRNAWNHVTPILEAQANKSLLALLYESPRVTSVHEWLRLSFEFKHEWELTKLIQLNTEYRSTLLISNIPRFFGMFSNQVSVGVSFRL